jgi:DNA-binding response OmpR family regulator
MHDITPLAPKNSERARRNARPSVLLIDDEIGPDDALLRLLALDGFDVECAPLGRAGLARGLGWPWDAMLLDLHLPDMPAVEILEGFRRENVGCPIVAITGWYEGDDCEIAARRLGATDFRRKPLDAEDVGACLRAAIAAFRARDADMAATCVHLETEPVATSTVAPEVCHFQRLHARARLGDEDAREQVLTQALPDLTRRLQRRFRRAPRDLVVDAVEDALLDYVSDPSRFDMTRDMPLLAFLLQAARRNLINRLQSERRWHDRQNRYATDAAARTADCGPGEGAELWQTLPANDLTKDDGERQAFELWRRGERRTGAFATVLGLSDRPLPEQVQGVKRFKDRLIKRIRRLFASTHGALLR